MDHLRLRPKLSLISSCWIPADQTLIPLICFLPEIHRRCLLPFCYHNEKEHRKRRETRMQNPASLHLITLHFLACTYLILLLFITLRIRRSGVRITLGAPERSPTYERILISGFVAFLSHRCPTICHSCSFRLLFSASAS